MTLAWAVLASLFGAAQAQVHCVTLPGGCDRGNAGDVALREAISRFQNGFVYGAINLIDFSSSVSNNILAQISYSCLDGSIPPPINGEVIQRLLQGILACENRCGSVLIEGTENCGLGVLLAEDASQEACFAKALDVRPTGVPAPITTSSVGTSNLPTITLSNSMITTHETTTNEIITTTSILSTSSAPPAPTIVDIIESFQNKGCIEDVIESRVIRADTFSGGMDIQKCVDFAVNGNWRYAGVEWGVECFVGNTLRSPRIASSSDCNIPCDGNPLQLCGAGNRIQVYEDKTWRSPTREVLIASLNDYQKELLEVKALLERYKQHWESYISHLESSLARRKRDDVLTERLREDIITIRIDTSLLKLLRESINRKARRTIRYFVIAKKEDIELDDRSPLIVEENVQELTAATSETNQAVDIILERSALDDPALEQALVTNAIPIVDAPANIAVASSSLGILGVPQVAGAIASGIFAVLFSLLTLLASSGGGGGNPQPDPQPTTTTSASCAPTILPTPVIVVTKKGTSSKHFDNLVGQVTAEKDAIIIDDINLESYDHRAFLATITQCTFDVLFENPLVSTIGYNALMKIENEELEIAERLTLRNNSLTQESPVSSLSDHRKPRGHGIHKRNIPSGYEDLKAVIGMGSQAQPWAAESPYHLNWLTAPWAQPGLAGNGYWYNYEEYLARYPTIPPPPARGRKTRVYILDTGARSDHIEFTTGVIVGGYDLNLPGSTYLSHYQPIPADNYGHGTRMASSVCGRYTGTNKRAAVVVMKISNGDAPNVWAIERAFAAIHADMKQFATTNAVASMSFGIDPAATKVDPWKQDGIVTDPFPRLLDDCDGNGIVPITATGNDPYEDLNILAPRCYGGAARTLIVVGAAASDGTRLHTCPRSDSSGRNILSIFTSAEDVLVGSNGAYNEFVLRSSSSTATALTAGLVALHLETNPLVNPRNVKQFLLAESQALKGLAWPVDDPSYGPHPRAALRMQVPCVPDPNSGPVPTATNPNRQLTTSETVYATDLYATVITNGPLPTCVQAPSP